MNEKGAKENISVSNSTQVGGHHYRDNRGGGRYQHWDWVYEEDLDYFQGQITKYVARWKKKNGLEDLYKARHFLDKYIELVTYHAEQESLPSHPAMNMYGGEAGVVTGAATTRNPY